MNADQFREKYFSGQYTGHDLELQMETNLIDVPEYAYRANNALYIENSGEACEPEIMDVPLHSIYGNGWLFGPRENAYPIASMLAYLYEKTKSLTNFRPIQSSYATTDGKFFINNADHRILLAFIMGWSSIPLQITKKNVSITNSDSNLPQRYIQNIKRYSM